MSRDYCALWVITFFRKKLRKGNGVWWALAYTFDQWKWLRIQNNPKRLREWFEWSE
jgi:hypothetical protein